jgi:O-antigen/teichoic acid export membrane protein
MSDQRLAAGRASRGVGAAQSGTASTAALGAGVMLRAGALSMGALVVLGVSRLAHGSLISHSVSAAAYGLVGSLIGITYVVALFVPAGLASAMTKYVAQSRGRADEAEASAVYTSLRRLSDISAIVLGAIAAVVAWCMFPLTVLDSVQVGLLAAMFSAYSVDKAALYGFDRVARYGWLELAGSGLAIVTTVFLVASLGDRPTAVGLSGSTQYLAPLTAGYAVVVVGSRFGLRSAVLRGGGGGPVAPDRRREILVFVGLAAVGAGSAAGLLQGVPLLAGTFADARSVGFLVAAVTLVSPLYLLPRVLGMALFPAMSHARGGGAEVAVGRSADVSMRATMVLLAPVFAAALPLAGPILAAYGGPQYSAGAPELRLLLMATYASAAAIGPINALASGTTQEARIPVIASMVGCVVGLSLVAPLGWWFGGAGVAGAYLVATIVISAGPMVAAARRWALRWRGMVARGVLAVGGAFAVATVSDRFDAGLLGAALAALLCCLLAMAVFVKDGKVLLTAARRTRDDDLG